MKLFDETNTNPFILCAFCDGEIFTTCGIIVSLNGDDHVWSIHSSNKVPWLKLARLLMISSLELKGGAICWRYTNITVAIVFLVIVRENANVLPNVRVSCGYDSVVARYYVYGENK